MWRRYRITDAGRQNAGVFKGGKRKWHAISAPKPSYPAARARILFWKARAVRWRTNAGSIVNRALMAAHREAVLPTTAVSFVRSKRLNGSMACLNVSSAVTLRTQSAGAATPANCCCSYSNRVLIMWSIEWVSGQRARQLVSHRAILVNGRIANIASLQVKPGDTVTIHDKAKQQTRIQEAVSLAEQMNFPGWVTVDAKQLEGIFKQPPQRDEIAGDINESLIVELYSR